MTRIAIYVPVFNRKAVTAQCLPTLRQAMSEKDRLYLYNDGSTQFDNVWLASFRGEVHSGHNIGTEAQRREHFKHFWADDASHLYFTDPDCFHDPKSFDMMLEIMSANNLGFLDGYDTLAHSTMPGNTVKDELYSPVIYRRFAPGISYLMDRTTVARIMPHVDRLVAFDWDIPRILGHYFPVCRQSVCDHIGRGGLRHPAGAGWDEGDRARNPTPWLIQKRKEIVAALQ